MQPASSVIARLREGVARLRDEGSSAAHDPELVHRVRVSSARLRTRVELVGARMLRDDLRWLRKSAAALRDLDVLVERAHPEPWARWLEHRRAEERSAFLATLASARAKGLLTAIEDASSADGDEDGARERIERLRERALRSARHLEDPKAADSAFHDLRRRLRRLRYALEWIDADAKPLEDVQAELGALNDHTTALRELERSPLAASLAAKRAALERDLAPRRARALKAWKAAKAWIEER